MPYDGEFAGYRALRRIAETERVQNLIRKMHVFAPDGNDPRPTPRSPPPASSPLPGFVVAIDGSNAEVDVQNGYPGAKVGYCTVASVLLDVGLMDQLDRDRPVDPREFRKTEEPATIDAALPGCNVVTRSHNSAQASFREALYETFHDVIIDEQDRVPLIDTYHLLLAAKPQSRSGTSGQRCPYEDCEERVQVPSGTTTCPCGKRRPIYSTDALRIHEGFRDAGSNREGLGEVMQVWERVMLVHLLRAFERRGWLSRVGQLGFILDGPLAVFGHPAWLSAAIESELKRLNEAVRKASGQDILLIGVEKTGEFVLHFEEVDRTETGEEFFPARSYQLLTDNYIKQRIKFSDSEKRYGEDTYFGRKFFYKTASGARLVASLPFLTDKQDTLDSEDVSLYPQFGTVCALLDKLVSSRFRNAISPLVSANAYAAIPLSLGAKVLEQLARALMGSRENL